MSLTYKIFGKPKTIEEFADKVEKEGSSKVTIKVYDKTSYDMGGYDVRLFIEASSEKSKFKKTLYSGGSATSRIEWDDSSKDLLDFVNSWEDVLIKKNKGLEVEKVYDIDIKK